MYTISRLTEIRQDASQAARMVTTFFMMFLPAGIAGMRGFIFISSDIYDDAGSRNISKTGSIKISDLSP